MLSYLGAGSSGRGRTRKSHNSCPLNQNVLTQFLFRVLTAQLLFLAPFFSWPGLRSLRSAPPTDPAHASSGTSRSTKKYALIALTLISVGSLISTMSRLPLVPPKPHKQGKADKRMLNAGIWTVHFGFDNEGHDSQRGMRELIKDMELDVVGLLETDLHRTAFGHRDLTRVLVEDLGYVSGNY